MGYVLINPAIYCTGIIIALEYIPGFIKTGSKDAAADRAPASILPRRIGQFGTDCNKPEIHAKERKEGRKEGEREGEKKKTEHPYVFISPTLEIAFERQKTESLPNWPIRLGRIDAGEWSTATSLEPVLINPGIYSSAIIIPVQYIAGFIKT